LRKRKRSFSLKKDSGQAVVKIYPKTNLSIINSLLSVAKEKGEKKSNILGRQGKRINNYLEETRLFRPSSFWGQGKGKG